MDCQNLQHSWCSEEHVTITQKYNSHQSHPDPVIANPNRVDQSDCRLDGITNFSTGFVKIQTQLFLTDEIPPCLRTTDLASNQAVLQFSLPIIPLIV
jgi:hypothetical protein